MLKITGARLETISDTDMYLFIEKGLRGDFLHCKANNKYMKNYDPTKPSKYLLYLDMNNLLYSGFKWLKNVNNFDVNSISENTLIGYILEVDLKYPNELHKLQIAQ